MGEYGVDTSSTIQSKGANNKRGGLVKRQIMFNRWGGKALILHEATGLDVTFSFLYFIQNGMQPPTTRGHATASPNKQLL